MSLSSKLSFGLYPRLKRILHDETGGVQYAGENQANASCCPTEKSKAIAIPIRTSASYLRRTCSSIVVTKSSSVSSSPKKSKSLLHRQHSVLGHKNEVETISPSLNDAKESQIQPSVSVIAPPIYKTSGFHNGDNFEGYTNVDFVPRKFKEGNDEVALLTTENMDEELTRSVSRFSQYTSSTTFTDAQPLQMRIVIDNNLMPGYVSPPQH